jgi:hypothetical protein
MRVGMGVADGAKRAGRQDEIAERAEPDDQDVLDQGQSISSR